MIILEDVQRLVAETGVAENDQRLRAIVAERLVKQLEGEVEKLKTQLKEKEDADSRPDTSGRPE